MKSIKNIQRTKNRTKKKGRFMRPFFAKEILLD